jgi:hypothetical protein
MPKNLLTWQGRLATQECETIAYAMRNYGPKDNLLTDYASYRIAATECQTFFFLDCRAVIAALVKAEADRLSRPELLVPFPVGAFTALATKLRRKRR